jgi:hypothetical protein
MSNYDILNAYIFKKNTEIIGTYPDNLHISQQESLSDTPYHNIVHIIDNKGEKGSIGNINYSYDDIDYQSKCYNCEPTDIPEKNNIESINNGEKDLTISPSISINYTLLTNEIEITISENENISINNDNIKDLRDLLHRQQKCNSGYKLIEDETSIGYCDECDVSDIPFSSYKQNSCEQECNENYTENPLGDTFECIILCGEGYKRNADDNTCEPCGYDHYKSGPENTDTECTQCPVGSTINSNETAKAITDCLARPGYELNDGDYTLKPGNLDDEIVKGVIDGCGNSYYYNGTECETCGTLAGIECTGGPIEGTNYPKRKLLSGYGLNNNIPYPCEGIEGREYRNGDIVIDYNDTLEDCTVCPGGSIGNGENNANTECTLLPGYKWKNEEDIPLNYEVTLKPGNNDEQQPYDGKIDNCDGNYYYHNNECIKCSDSPGIKCDGGPWSEAKKYLNPGYGTIVEEFYSIKQCDGEREYRHGEVEYNDNTQIPCNLCPIGSISNTKNDACDLNNGYRWEDNSNSAPNYQTTLMSGYLDNETPIGEIDGCETGYYYDGNNCVECNYGEGIECTGGPISASKRMLQPRYSWTGTTAEHCDNKYRLEKEEVQDGQAINCNSCPIGTSYDGNNGCELNTGYSWSVDEQRATKCPNGYKRYGTVTIGDSNITCDLCDDKPINSVYRDSEGNQLYNSDGSCQWSCDSGYQRNNNECLKECYAGEKRNESSNTCEPCEADYYKELGTEETYTNTSCSPCPIGSTTNSNTGSQSIDSCTARPGYEYSEIDSNYRRKDGNIDDNPDGIIDGCENSYYYNGTECVTCGPFGDGIECTTGDIEYENNEVINYPKRKLLSGHGLNNNTSYPCVGDQYRNGDIVIGYDDTLESCTRCPTGSIGSTGSISENDANTQCSLLPGYRWEDNHSSPPNYLISIKDGNLDNEPPNGTIDECRNGYYYNGTECVTCGPFGYGIECIGGPINDQRKEPKRYLLPGYQWNQNSKESSECPEGKYRTNKIEIQMSNIPCSNTCDGNQRVNEQRTGCLSNNGYHYNSDDKDDFYCVSKYYYNGTECIQCGENDYTNCDGGSENGDKGKKMLIAGYGTDKNGAGIECTDGKYREGDIEFENSINCEECNYTQCPDNKILVGCDGASSGECSECPVGEIPNTDKTSCETPCDYNEYYDETFCPVNSQYDEEIGLCVCNEGYELNDSGDGCKIIRKLSRYERCNNNNECYSGRCVTFCQPVSLGHTCRNDSDCSSNSRCYNGKCIKRLFPYNECNYYGGITPCNSCQYGYYNNYGDTECQPASLYSGAHCDTRPDELKIAPGCDKCRYGHKMEFYKDKCV